LHSHDNIYDRVHSFVHTQESGVVDAVTFDPWIPEFSDWDALEYIDEDVFDRVQDL
jgi:hypothetical protein